jgi:hypothetical protein
VLQDVVNLEVEALVHGRGDDKPGGLVRYQNELSGHDSPGFYSRPQWSHSHQKKGRGLVMLNSYGSSEVSGCCRIINTGHGL